MGNNQSSSPSPLPQPSSSFECVICNQSSSPSPLPQPSSSFECVICTESSIPYNKKFINNNNTQNNNKKKFINNGEKKSTEETKNGCSHPFCIDCIAKHIQVKVEGEENTAEVRCPDIECGSLLDPYTCQSILSPPVFERWCDLLLEHMLLTKMSGKTLYCPYRNCSTQLLLNDDRKQKWCPQAIRTKAECPFCKKNFCYKCKTPWHAGYRCEEAPRSVDANDVLFGRMAEGKKWTRCPTCRRYVERTKGCKNIKCRCGTSFCYDCGTLNCVICRSNRLQSVVSLILAILSIPLFMGIAIGIILFIKFCVKKGHL